MSHAAQTRLNHVVPPAISQADAEGEVLTMRLLRHHTKNALQRIIAQVSAADLQASPGGEPLADDIARRIRLSARISDALFGLTEAPGPLEQRLTMLCQGVVALMSDCVQRVGVSVRLLGTCPKRLERTVLQIAHEMVTNAVKHGMHMRLVGEIEVVLAAKRPDLMTAGGLSLEVRDNGWGPDRQGFGDGLATLQLMAQQHRGHVVLVREACWTVSRLHIPALA